MQTIKNRAFTIVEMLICLAILVVILGFILIMMTRGASNVQKGSFNALAANQAFWIVSVMRNDISRSLEEINLEVNEESVWNGESDLKIKIEGGTASYKIENKGNKKVLVRTFVPSDSGIAFKVSDSKTQRFGDEFLTDMAIKLNDDNSYLIDITMTDPNKSTGGKHEFTWTSTIYPPHHIGLEQYWVSTLND